jgi:pantothenate synthetase
VFAVIGRLLVKMRDEFIREQMVHDLLMPVKIVGQPIVREADGLAMSSRNSYLNAAERALAQTRAAQWVATVQLVKSLGGGWEGS